MKHNSGAVVGHDSVVVIVWRARAARRILAEAARGCEGGMRVISVVLAGGRVELRPVEEKPRLDADRIRAIRQRRADPAGERRNDGGAVAEGATKMAEGVGADLGVAQ